MDLKTLNNTLNLLLLKYRCIYRIFIELGYPRVILTIILFFSITLCIRHFNNTLSPFIGLFFCILCILIVQQSRDDLQFIYTSLYSPSMYLTLDYLFIGSVLGVLLFHRFYFFIFLPFVCYSVQFIPKLLIKKNTPKRVFWAKKSFEWVAGIRKYYFSYSFLIILLLMGLHYTKEINTICSIAIWVRIFLVNSYFTIVEDKDMLLSFNVSSSSFLLKKIYYASKYLLFLILPFIVITYFTNTSSNFHVWEMTANILIGIILLVVFILIKYAFYPNSFLIRLFHFFFYIIVPLSIIAPSLLILLIIMIIKLWSLASNKLKYYLP